MAYEKSPHTGKCRCGKKIIKMGFRWCSRCRRIRKSKNKHIFYTGLSIVA